MMVWQGPNAIARLPRHLSLSRTESCYVQQGQGLSVLLGSKTEWGQNCQRMTMQRAECSTEEDGEIWKDEKERWRSEGGRDSTACPWQDRLGSQTPGHSGYAIPCFLL